MVSNKINNNGTYPDDVVTGKYTTGMSVVPVLSNGTLHFLLDRQKFFILGQQIDQQCTRSNGRLPQSTRCCGQQFLHTFDQFMPISVSGHANLFQILVTHFRQYIQGYAFPFKQFEQMFQSETLKEASDGRDVRTAAIVFLARVLGVPFGIRVGRWHWA